VGTTLCGVIKPLPNRISAANRTVGRKERPADRLDVPRPGRLPDCPDSCDLRELTASPEGHPGNILYRCAVECSPSMWIRIVEWASRVENADHTGGAAEQRPSSRGSVTERRPEDFPTFVGGFRRRRRRRCRVSALLTRFTFYGETSEPTTADNRSPAWAGVLGTARSSLPRR
jgi:hypothetical protein